MSENRSTAEQSDLSYSFKQWQTLNPGQPFSAFYAQQAEVRIKAGEPHSTLGDKLKGGEPFESAGLRIFGMLKAFGLSEDAVCVDYGCGTLRIGLHAIRFLAPGAYWGLDVSGFFLDQGRKLVGEKLIAEKQPNLRLISPETLAEATSHKPNIVFSIAVMFHVHPDELNDYVRNLMTLAGADGKVIFWARATEQTIHYKERCWSHSRKAIEAAFAAQGAGLEALSSESVTMPGFPNGKRYWFSARRVKTVR